MAVDPTDGIWTGRCSLGGSWLLYSSIVFALASTRPLDHSHFCKSISLFTTTGSNDSIPLYGYFRSGLRRQGLLGGLELPSMVECLSLSSFETANLVFYHA
ncbi:hypothetical protein FRB95_009898 [Tulasnella sp. JGI-2019a]|nr:hypothetical protein FRB95_009898 [Tulasnella sp. JGI-2019a]